MDMYIDAGMNDRDPYWARPWPCGIALAEHLLRSPGLVQGLRVCDLGAGLGVAGLAAALAGAVEVALLDREPLALKCAALGAQANGLIIQDAAQVAATHQDTWLMVDCSGLAANLLPTTESASHGAGAHAMAVGLANQCSCNRESKETGMPAGQQNKVGQQQPSATPIPAHMTQDVDSKLQWHRHSQHDQRDHAMLDPDGSVQLWPQSPSAAHSAQTHVSGADDRDATPPQHPEVGKDNPCPSQPPLDQHGHTPTDPPRADSSYSQTTIAVHRPSAVELSAAGNIRATAAPSLSGAAHGLHDPLPGQRCAVWLYEFDWSRAVQLPDGCPLFDVVLACDVLYESFSVSPIVDVLPALLQDGGLLLLADPPCRTPHNREAFLSALRERWGEVVVQSIQECSCAAAAAGNEMVAGTASGEVIPVQVMELRLHHRKVTTGPA